MIKEQGAGMPTVEVCRRHGLSPATFYKLKSKYDGLEISDAARPHSSPGNQTPLQARQALEEFEGPAPGALAQSKTQDYQHQTRRPSL